ncbi:MAG TPA: NAD(P)/FAD-dependent oxidoreductase [Gemmatimonadaceae bacterium]
MSTTPDTRPRVVIIGGGFGGLYAARALSRADASITVLDRTNHHLFQPLLYQVATAALAPTDITSPIRSLLSGQANTAVFLENVDRVDLARRVVVTEHDSREVPYDYLILATGTNHSYFGHEEWGQLAPGLKSIADAREIRRRFLLAFENAEKSNDEQARDEWLTFVIVGGGPTGVELAGMIPEVTHNAMRRDFRRIDTRRTRVILLEGGPRVLPSFPDDLSAKAARDLTKLGVQVRANARVTNITQNAVFLGDERIPTRSVFWAAGNAASPLARTLGVPLDAVGRVLVQPDLSVPGHPEVFVVGDLAVVLQANGALVPGVAPAAMQEGRSAARNILARIKGQPARPFKYLDKGNLATIGRHKAVADFGRFHVTGYIAWWFWLFVHILYLAGFRNRLSVLIEWAYAYFTYGRGARLIAQDESGVQDPTQR